MKKLFYFATIFAFALFLLPACEKEVISSDDDDEDKDEQVDSDTNGKSCYEVVFTMNDVVENYTSTFSYVVWETKEEAEAIASEVAELNTESGYNDNGEYYEYTMTFEIIKLDSSQNACRNNEDYVDDFWSMFE